MTSRIYLDNAATSWPKPDTVYYAVEDFQRRVGASMGRSVYDAAAESARIVDRAREGIASFIGEPDASRIIFTANGTESLCTAIFGLLREGGHVVTTVCDHNSVLRPLHALSTGVRGVPIVETTHVGCDAEGIVDAEEVAAAIRPDTRLVAIIHSSNVTGAVQPIEAIAKHVHEKGSLLLVDVAQTLGRWPVNVGSFGADIIATPGHKGLLGPLGTGFLWMRPGLESQIFPLRYGGTGSMSDSLEQPDKLPFRYESGSLNMPGIVGLAAGVEHLLSVGVVSQQRQIGAVTDQLRTGLSEIEGVQLYGPADLSRQAGVVSFTMAGYDPQEVAMLLASLAGVECRAGLHCAPLMHKALGTFPAGTVRFTPGATTSPEQITKTIEAVKQLAATPLCEDLKSRLHDLPSCV